MDLVVELPGEINLVRLDKPEVVTFKTKIEQSKYTEANTNKILRCNEVLDRILPEKEWEKDNKIYRRKISTEPGTKTDIESLSRKLDMYLKQYNAKDVGLCPIRQQLHFQCFNEIIRQVTLKCPLRGNMLIQIRDENKKFMDGYQKLYESGITFKIRYFLLREKYENDLKARTEELNMENKQLEVELAEMFAKTNRFNHEMAEARKAELKSHAKAVGELKKANEAIRVHLEDINNPNYNPIQ